VSAPKEVGVQCQGTNTDMATQTAVSVLNSAGVSIQRFGAASIGAEQVLRNELGLADRLPVGTPPRCEQLVFPSAQSGIRQGELFWQAIEIWVDDWAGTSDDQLVLQWHQNDPRLLQNPYLAVLLKGNSLRVEVRANAANPATRAGNSIFTQAVPAWKPRQWNTIILQGKITPLSAQQPVLRMWVNGEKVIDRNQPLGFSLQAGSYNYVKWGIYKWTDGNTWDASRPLRSMMTKNMLLVRDPTTRYSAATLTTALKSR
jgi:hypothetical protein